MIRKLSLASKIFICIGITSLFAVALSKGFNRKGFKDKLLQFIESSARKEEALTYVQKKSDRKIQEAAGSYTSFDYSQGDWEKFVIQPKYKLILEGPYDDSYKINDSDNINVNSYGSLNLDMTYGKSKFRDDKYHRFDEDSPESRVIDGGFNFDRKLQLHLEGEMGRRMTVYIDHDSQKKDNHYQMQYRAIHEAEVIREINAGEIDIDFEHSKYAIYDDTSSKGLGVDLKIKKGNLRVRAFGSVTKGETEVEVFRGNSSPNYIKLAEYQFVRSTYYQLEPFRRYDGLESPPASSSNNYVNLVTFTSNPSNPGSFMPYAVNIDNTNFELYMDDQEPHNNLNSTRLDIDGGYYDKLVSGIDYKMNYSTGLIVFLKAVPDSARIFALYTLNGGSTSSSDTAARTDVFPGRIFVFIKYGHSIDEDSDDDFVLDTGEDRNSDGRLNLDIYEVRSFYNIGEKQIHQDNFRIQFFEENGIMKSSEVSTLGKYSVVYSEGTVMFNLREPFRQILGNRADNIYSENQSGNVFTDSQYNIRIDYYRKARSFQLKHFNIIPDTVRIKINGREITSSLYSIDYTSGFLEFTDPNNPVIGDETEIEVRYEYIPFGSQSKSLVTGVRTDYKINRNLNIGGTLLYTRDSGVTTIPDIGSEPEQTLVLEADTSMHMGEKSIKKVFKTISGYNAGSVPVELNGYAEYARSYKKTNVFGKALIDDMETTEEVVSISLSEKDWILSSIPSGITGIDQSDRGKIFYYFYRDPSKPSTLKGLDFFPYSVPYSTKPGPYNVATGHIPDSTQAVETQRALVFNFDFSTGDYIPVVTRSLSSDAVDFSGLQYLEIWYRSDGGEGEVELYIDVGDINEDSDDDGQLETEDINNNGFLDFDPHAGIYEDIGYEFNPDGADSTRIGTGPKLSRYTIGDGVLNSEDLNQNGILDTRENIIRIPGDSSYPNNSGSPLRIDLSDTSWQKARIYLDRTSSEYVSKRELLKSVESIRLFIKKSGPANTGTIYIDTLKFVSSSWRDIEINGSSDYSPQEFRVTKIDTINDSDYRAQSYMLFAEDNYESLHGEKSDSQTLSEIETALQIEYNFSSVNNGSTTKRFARPLDIRRYKTLNLWFNFLEYTEGDSVSVVIGSSENDYMKYEFPMGYRGLWRDISLKLSSDSNGNIAISDVSGNPDLKRVKYIKIIIYGQNSGRLWINDMYVSEPEMMTDSAYWYEGEIKFKRPLFYTDSRVPVFSDISIKYIQKGHGAEFSTVGQTVEDVKESYREVFSQAMVLPNWRTNLDFIAEDSKTDALNEDVQETKRGETGKRSINFESDYTSSVNAFPSIKLIYKQDDYENTRNEYLSFNEITRRTDSLIYSPTLILNEKIDRFLFGSLSSIILLEGFFKKEKIKRHYEELYSFDPDEQISPEEIENRQKGGSSISIDYQNKYFFFKPSVDASSHEIVKLSGKEGLNDTEILTDVDGGFHFPLIYNKDFKFVERDKRTRIEFGVKEIGPLSPMFAIELSYFDKRFRDYDESEREISGSFSRAKNADSFISNKIDFPFTFDYTGSLAFIRSIHFSYSRSIYFQEMEIPYEGEGTSAFDEEYGLNKTYHGFAGTCINLYKYPPWRFFTGRGNYARGRDYAYEKFNEGLYFQDGSPVSNYNNLMRLIDNFFVSSTLDFEMIVVSPGAGITQTSERQIIFGIPQQAVTVNLNCNVTIDLMQIFHFSFFRPNKTGMPYHSASMNLDYAFNRNMLITSNIEENSHVPGIGMTFKRDRSSIGFLCQLDYIRRKKREYISLTESKRDRSDDIYITNMQSMEDFKEIDKTYSFICFYETDVQWLYNLFSKLYKLVAYPIFSIEYSLLLNKYDYTVTISPEPYDQHLVTEKLTMDLHKNVQGGLTGKWALEKFRNRDTDGINREIISYEIGLNFTLLF